MPKAVGDMYMNNEAETLEAIAKDRPEAGELYIKTTHPKGGEQREVHGKGTVEHGTAKDGVYVCLVNSISWDRYANQRFN